MQTANCARCTDWWAWQACDELSLHKLDRSSLADLVAAFSEQAFHEDNIKAIFAARDA